MRISELDNKAFLANDGVGDNSYVVITYAEDANDSPVSFKATLNELGRLIVSNMKLAQYDTQNDKKDLGTLVGVSKLKPTSAPEESGNEEPSNEEPVVEEPETEEEPIEREVYNPIHLGQFLTDADRPLLTNLETDYADASAANNKFVWKVTRTSGTLAAEHADFSPTITWTDGTSSAKPTISISVAGNSAATAATPNEASTTVYGITKLSNAIDSDSEVLAATPKAVKDALQSLDITKITNTAGMTIKTIEETDGKVSATFQNIEIPESQVTNLTTHLGQKLETNLKGAANGLAELDDSGRVPAAQLPAYVDDVIEGYLYNGAFYEEATHETAITGMGGKIYVDITENAPRLVYRWSGSAFVAIPIGLALGETSSTAYRGDYGARAYAHAGASPQYTAAASGLYRVTVNNEGHVTATAAVQASDITGLLGTAAVKNVPTTGNAGNEEVVLGSDGRFTDLSNLATLVSTFLDNFDFTLSLPTSVTWNVDENTNELSATPNMYNDNSTTITIQKQDGSSWINYTTGTRTEGEHYRAYCERTLTLNSKTYTNNGVIGEEYIEPAAVVPEPDTEPEPEGE